MNRHRCPEGFKLGRLKHRVIRDAETHLNYIEDRQRQHSVASGSIPEGAIGRSGSQSLPCLLRRRT